MINTAECLFEERQNGRAKHILYFPKWMIISGYFIIKVITGKNKYTFILNKTVHPIRTD
jgi:hypothetical protein